MLQLKREGLLFDNTSDLKGQAVVVRQTQLIVVETAAQSKQSKLKQNSNNNIVEFRRNSTASSASSRSSSFGKNCHPLGNSATVDFNTQRSNGTKLSVKGKLQTKGKITKKNPPTTQSYNVTLETVLQSKKQKSKAIKFGSCRGSITDTQEIKENIQEVSAVRLIKKRESISKNSNVMKENKLLSEQRTSIKKIKDLHILRRNSNCSNLDDIQETPLGYHSNQYHGQYYSQTHTTDSKDSRNENRLTNVANLDTPLGVSYQHVPITSFTLDKRTQHVIKQGIEGPLTTTGRILGNGANQSQRVSKTQSKCQSISGPITQIQSKKSLLSGNGTISQIQSNLYNRFNECEEEIIEKQVQKINATIPMISNDHTPKNFVDNNTQLVERVFKKRQEARKQFKNQVLSKEQKESQTFDIKPKTNLDGISIARVEKTVELTHHINTRNQPRLGFSQPKKYAAITTAKKTLSYDYQVLSDDKSKRIMQTNITNSLILSPSPYMPSMSGKQTPQFTQSQSIKLAYENMRKSNDTKWLCAKQFSNPTTTSSQMQQSSSLIRIEEMSPRQTDQDNECVLESFMGETTNLFKSARKTLVYPYLSKKITSTSLDRLADTMMSCSSLVEKQGSPRFGLGCKESLLQQANINAIQNMKIESQKVQKSRFTLNSINQMSLASHSSIIVKQASLSRNTIGHSLSNLPSTHSNISEQLLTMGRNPSTQSNLNVFEAARQKILKSSSSLERGESRVQSSLPLNIQPVKSIEGQRSHRKSLFNQQNNNTLAKKSTSVQRTGDSHQVFQTQRASQCQSNLIRGLMLGKNPSPLGRPIYQELARKEAGDQTPKAEMKAHLTVCKSPVGFKKNLHYNQPKLIKRDKSHLIRILYHVVKFMNIDSLIKLAHTGKKFSKTKEIKFVLNQQFRCLVIKGLSTIDRIKYWNYRTRFVYYRKKYKNLYHKIIAEKKSEYQTDIQKDLDRTFPSLKHFSKGNLGQDQLERLLTAISIYYKKLGYVQGMNFIVGTVQLSFQNEEDAFWMMISMLVNFKLDQLLTFESNKFRVICYQIDMFVKAYLPQLYEIFVSCQNQQAQKENDLSSEFYASQWLFTFFSIDLPFDIVYIVIDLFLLEGYSALIRICLTMLKLIETDLLELSYDESLVFLKTFGRHLETDTEDFFKKAMSFKISKQMCKDLEANFFNSKGPQEMIFDYQTQSWGLLQLECSKLGPSSTTSVATSLTTNMDVNEEAKTAFIDEVGLQKRGSPRKYNAINAIGNRVKSLFSFL